MDPLLKQKPSLDFAIGCPEAGGGLYFTPELCLTCTNWALAAPPLIMFQCKHAAMLPLLMSSFYL